MKTIVQSLFLATALFGAASLPASQDDPVLTQGRISQTSISVSTNNGQTTVTYNGKEVFSGPTKGKVTSRAASRNGKDYAAAWDDDKVIWENVKGAAEMLK